jgi:hypothetical protein
MHPEQEVPSLKTAIHTADTTPWGCDWLARKWELVRSRHQHNDIYVAYDRGTMMHTLKIISIHRIVQNVRCKQAFLSEAVYFPEHTVFYHRSVICIRASIID